MSTFDCTAARRLLDAVDPLTTEQQQVLDVHLACCDDCRERGELLAGLQRAVRETPLPPLEPMLERRLLTSKAPTRPSRAEQRGRPWLAAAALATTCGAAAAWLVFQLVTPPPSVEPEHLPTPTQVADDTTPVRPAELALTCAAPGTALWIEDSADVVEGHNDRNGAHFHLDRGRVVAEVGDNDPGYRFVVETPSVLVEALGTIFSVEVGPDGREIVRVTEGLVDVLDATSRQPLGQVSAGQEMVVGDPVPETVTWETLERDLDVLDLPQPQANDVVALVAPEAPVEEPPLSLPEIAASTLPEEAVAVADTRGTDDNLALLTSLAHAHQRAGEYQSACSVYQRIIDTHPDSAAARNGLVTLGQIELSALGQPVQALQRFDRYLTQAPTGVLAEEARIGRVRALTQLGQAPEVILETTEFIHHHSDSSARAEMLRLRGDAHRANGDLERAALDYEELLARWPSSPQADFAQAGLAACTGQ